MTIRAVPLIHGKFASTSTFAEYTVGESMRVIVDKFTATNIAGTDQTVSIYIVRNGQSVGNQYLIVKSRTVSAGATFDCSEMKNQILAEGDFIAVSSNASGAIAIRASGREIEE